MAGTRFGAAVIAGDNVSKEAWNRMADSLAVADVGVIALAWNGSSRKPPRWMRDCALPVAYAHLPWNDDFAEQRNASFELASRLCEWVLWIDTDDELVAPDGFESLVESLDAHTHGVFLRYDYASDSEGRPVVVQWRERLLKAALEWKWIYPVHEVCHGPFGTQYAKREEAFIRHHRHHGRDEATRSRNRRIIEGVIETSDNPLFRYYLGNETYADAHDEKDNEKRVELLKLAASYFVDYVGAVSAEDNAYFANHRTADILRELGELHKAMDTDLQGIKLRPRWPDAYNGIALTAIRMEEYAVAEQWATLCIDVARTPDTTQSFEPFELDYTPYAVRSVAREHLGNFEGAVEDIEKAIEIWSPPELMERLMRLREIVEFDDSKTEDDHKSVRKSLRDSSPERAIAFFTKPGAEPWHTRTEAVSGLGGSETAIVRLVPRFAREGWRVVVFGTPGPHKGVDENGVEWWDYDDFVHSEKFDVVVASRAPELFDSPVNARKFVWMHDVNVMDGLDPELHPKRLRDVQVLAVSRWHAEHIRRLYGLEALVVPNGIEASLYERPLGPKQRGRFVYASSADRGLEALLEMWPEIRRRWPEAELDVFYGWEYIDKLIVKAPSHAARLVYLRRAITQLLEENGVGVNWRGRVPQSVLADHLYKTDAWLYPTAFCETFCITAYEMQAAGVVPITSDLAALKEAVPAAYRVGGWPGNSTYRESWMQMLENHMQRSDAELDHVREALRARAIKHTWDAAFEVWQTICERAMVTA